MYARFLGNKSHIGTGSLTTTLADLEDACRTAKGRGWSREQVASELRTAGARWADGRITACHPAARGYLMTKLTVGSPSI